MIICKDYKNGYTNIENGKKVYYVFAELYTGAVPDTMPTNAVGIENFPQNFPLEDVKFAAGSTLYCANTTDVYLTDDNCEWKVQ